MRISRDSQTRSRIFELRFGRNIVWDTDVRLAGDQITNIIMSAGFQCCSSEKEVSSQVPESSILDPLRPELLESKPFRLDIGHEEAGVE